MRASPTSCRTRGPSLTHRSSDLPIRNPTPRNTPSRSQPTGIRSRCVVTCSVCCEGGASGVGGGGGGGGSGLAAGEGEGEVAVGVGPRALDGEAGRGELGAQALGTELRRDLDADLLAVRELERQVGAR